MRHAFIAWSTLLAVTVVAGMQAPLALAADEDTGGTAGVPSRLSAEGLEEVTVTAQRREENLQKTPLAVIAISGEQLVRAGVNQAQDLNKLVPGLKIGQTGTMTQFFINGVGSGVANAYGDPTVAFPAL